MPQNYPKQKPGFFGVQRFTLQTGQIGGADFLGGATPLTANATTIFRAGAPRTKSRFNGMTTTIGVTLPIDADGTVVVKAVKYDASANAAVDLTAASVNLETANVVLREAVVTGALSSATDAELTFDTGDTLEFHVTSDSAAIDTQPAGIVFVGEFLALE